jgi:CRISPR-associated endonuclease Csn1
MISYRLGIDIGSNSVGWAAIRTNDSLPVGILRAGVRIFEAGVHGDLAQGREESRGPSAARCVCKDGEPTGGGAV